MCDITCHTKVTAKNDIVPLDGDNEWLQDAAGGQKTTAGAALDFVILIALCGLNCFIVPNKQA